MLELGFFYMFAGLAVMAALGVVMSRNTVHSVMFLIFCFFNSAGLFFLLDAEFIGILLILIYVGAVMVLFMFVVMMLEVNFAGLREGFLRYLPIGGMIALILFIEIVAAGSSGVFSPEGMPDPGHAAQHVNNTVEIGKVLYTRYLLGFEVAAIILLVALIGSVVLTLRVRKDAKYQNISRQVNVDPADRLRKVKM
ncbi:MAG: NADH-quinone oxidoreductase subunit J [Zetaproteobacteria bacterium]|nr:MAG: NADH-quinone oxidoreductase subunit J [Zetaproteobacteria bacterium]